MCFLSASSMYISHQNLVTVFSMATRSLIKPAHSTVQESVPNPLTIHLPIVISYLDLRRARKGSSHTIGQSCLIQVGYIQYSAFWVPTIGACIYIFGVMLLLIEIKVTNIHKLIEWILSFLGHIFCYLSYPARNTGTVITNWLSRAYLM